MTEKPELEFDPSKIPSFDPMEEFKEKGQLHVRRDGTTQISKKPESPAERIEREERDAAFYDAIMKDQQETSQTNIDKRDRY
tara:strand:- start:322 stop:567 length:246 start_codon:yes stop_codon:yes gene_type:complete